ncbi:minor extracellular serine protease Vpr [Paenibacillus sp. SORGH_AS338]|uniref:S8 family serine peptidase n=1 Tax=Paenibacillus sp. SORGH_AS_0338 TaxID=3041755 RepID=UPI00285FA151|nr:S8 family serine peptidase [Paenibacillus sp. SORGH_AS_0338]MDR6110059.1 minor extracellular serine protease Vpr [Paenibacillus sp. SORGH_AS_0338]
MTKLHVIRKFSVVSMAAVLAVGTLLSPTASFAAEAGTGTASSPYEIGRNLPSVLLNQTSNEAPVISPKLNVTSSKVVRVIVQLSNQPVAVGQYAAEAGVRSFATESTERAIDSQQAAIVNAAKEQGILLKVNYRYNTVLNGMEVSIPANQIPKLAELPGVKSIYENSVYYTIPVQDPPSLTATTATYDASPLNLIGAPVAWQKGLTGKGVKVGVIDTGVDYEHPDLKGAYKGGYDSFEKDNDPYEEPPIAIEDDPYGTGFAGTSHGTHVSGTIVGRAANKTSDIVQKGIAYDADLYVYKVLGRNAETGRSSGSSAQVIDGIERAVKDGMDVINLSLGSDAEKDVNSPDVIAINNAVLSGVVAVIANGNAAKQGYYYYSMGSPASSQLAISVGASTIPTKQFTSTVTASVYKTEADATAEAVSAAAVNYHNADDTTTVTADAYGQSYGLNLMAWRTGNEDFQRILGTSPLDGVYVGLGLVGDYVGKDVKDKVVLISRGSATFVDKIKVAKENGAKAAIIFNGNVKASDPLQADLSESVSGRDGQIGSSAFLGDGFEYIPTFDMAGKEGRALAREALKFSADALTFKFGSSYPKTEKRGDTMADFSSRGPNQDGLLGIKPDLVAPGVSIESTIPAYGKFIKDASYAEAYTRQNGTSMASPHIAGLAVLLKQEHPDWTPFDIRAALVNTADVIKDENDQQYDVYSQGAGRANVAAAVYSPALLETVEPIVILDKNLNKKTVTNYGSSAAFGVLKPGSAEQTKKLQLKNTSSLSVSYKASIKLHSDVTSDPYNSTSTPDVSNISATLKGLDANGSILLGGNSTKEFSLAVKPNASAATGPYEGEVVLTANGYPTLHLPFVLHVGTELPDTGLGIQEVTVSNTNIRLDGKQDVTDIGFHLTSKNSNVIELNVYGLDDELRGTAAQYVQTPTEDGYPLFDPGYYQFNDIDNVIMATENGKVSLKALEPGTYKLQLAAYNVSPTGSVDSNSIYTSSAQYRIVGTEKTRIATAKKPFNYIIDGNNVLGQSVFTLPTDNRVDYKVLSSDDPKYVDNNGVLIKYPASGSRMAKLKVQITSVTDPTATVTVNALVKITAPKK